MPPRLSKSPPGYLRPSQLIPRLSYNPSCSIGSIIAAASSRSHYRSWQKAFTCLKPKKPAQRQSNLASIAPSIEREKGFADPYEPVPRLKIALIELQKQAQSYVNVSRLQLALRGLQQRTGEETIRVAILGLGQDGISRTVWELVRLLLADPLKEEEEWERLLTAENQDRPILLRVGKGIGDNTTNSGANNKLIRELSISSPTLNAHQLEIFILNNNIILDSTTAEENFNDLILVPSIDIPTSSTGQYTSVATPVHKAIIIGEGILGAASLLKLGINTDHDIIVSAVDLPGYVHKKKQNPPFQLVNVILAKNALLKFRKSLDNAVSYEHDWFDSGLSELLDWLKAGTQSIPGGDHMKSPIRSLISSILTDATRQIQVEESRRLSAHISSKVSSVVLQTLRGDLKTWAERAHTELRDQLDVAFEGKRWSKLGWWKLFWRVDDVYMIASDILNRRFLPDAEKEIIFLAGKIEEAGVPKSLPGVQESNWAYKPVPRPPPSTRIGSPPDNLYFEDIIERPSDESNEIVKLQPWPLHIPTTRSYLSTDTVPALQALAQKLVIQTLTNSSFASLLSGLIYISSVSTSVYEAGAVAAFGVVWSLRRMQKKWEIARSFWEGEVGEEGRKAIRAVEVVVEEVLNKAEAARSTTKGEEELNQAREAVERASKALVIATREAIK